MKLLAAAVPASLLAAVAALPAWHMPTQLTSPVSQQHADARTPTAAAAGEQTRRERAPLKLPLANPKIVVSKSARRLELYSGGHVVREYRVVLGGDPVNDKEREGDSRTPEGDFYVCVKNERSQFYRSLGLSYPNREDAERGLRDKLITRAQHDRILRAIARKRTPPWNTSLGGEIYIHGGGTSNDWTAGCVALDNTDMQELFDSVPVGTPVRIEP
jgi:lipoprotein-anchoring transpeptidase ErfK/SrfK